VRRAFIALEEYYTAMQGFIKQAKNICSAGTCTHNADSRLTGCRKNGRKAWLQLTPAACSNS
jgi:hypothetical protein